MSLTYLRLAIPLNLLKVSALRSATLVNTTTGALGQQSAPRVRNIRSILIDLIEIEGLLILIEI